MSSSSSNVQPSRLENPQHAPPTSSEQHQHLVAPAVDHGSHSAVRRSSASDRPTSIPSSILANALRAATELRSIGEHQMSPNESTCTSSPKIGSKQSEARTSNEDLYTAGSSRGHETQQTTAEPSPHIQKDGLWVDSSEERWKVDDAPPLGNPTGEDDPYRTEAIQTTAPSTAEREDWKVSEEPSTRQIGTEGEDAEESEDDDDEVGKWASLKLPVPKDSWCHEPYQIQIDAPIFSSLSREALFSTVPTSMKDILMEVSASKATATHTNNNKKRSSHSWSFSHLAVRDSSKRRLSPISISHGRSRSNRVFHSRSNSRAPSRASISRDPMRSSSNCSRRSRRQRDADSDAGDRSDDDEDDDRSIIYKPDTGAEEEEEDSDERDNHEHVDANFNPVAQSTTHVQQQVQPQRMDAQTLPPKIVHNDSQHNDVVSERFMGGAVPFLAGASETHLHVEVVVSTADKHGSGPNPAAPPPPPAAESAPGRTSLSFLGAESSQRTRGNERDALLTPSTSAQRLGSVNMKSIPDFVLQQIPKRSSTNQRSQYFVSTALQLGQTMLLPPTDADAPSPPPPEWLAEGNHDTPPASNGNAGNDTGHMNAGDGEQWLGRSRRSSFSDAGRQRSEDGVGSANRSFRNDAEKSHSDHDLLELDFHLPNVETLAPNVTIRPTAVRNPRERTDERSEAPKNEAPISTNTPQLSLPAVVGIQPHEQQKSQKHQTLPSANQASESLTTPTDGAPNANQNSASDITPDALGSSFSPPKKTNTQRFESKSLNAHSQSSQPPPLSPFRPVERLNISVAKTPSTIPSERDDEAQSPTTLLNDSGLRSSKSSFSMPSQHALTHPSLQIASHTRWKKRIRRRVTTMSSSGCATQLLSTSMNVSMSAPSASSSEKMAPHPGDANHELSSTQLPPWETSELRGRGTQDESDPKYDSGSFMQTSVSAETSTTPQSHPTLQTVSTSTNTRSNDQESRPPHEKKTFTVHSTASVHETAVFRAPTEPHHHLYSDHRPESINTPGSLSSPLVDLSRETSSNTQLGSHGTHHHHHVHHRPSPIQVLADMTAAMSGSEVPGITDKANSVVTTLASPSTATTTATTPSAFGSPSGALSMSGLTTLAVSVLTAASGTPMLTGASMPQALAAQPRRSPLNPSYGNQTGSGVGVNSANTASGTSGKRETLGTNFGTSSTAGAPRSQSSQAVASPDSQNAAQTLNPLAASNAVAELMNTILSAMAVIAEKNGLSLEKCVRLRLRELYMEHSGHEESTQERSEQASDTPSYPYATVSSATTTPISTAARGRRDSEVGTALRSSPATATGGPIPQATHGFSHRVPMTDSLEPPATSNDDSFTEMLPPWCVPASRGWKGNFNSSSTAAATTGSNTTFPIHNATADGNSTSFSGTFNTNTSTSFLRPHPQSLSPGAIAMLPSTRATSEVSKTPRTPQTAMACSYSASVPANVTAQSESSANKEQRDHSSHTSIANYYEGSRLPRAKTPGDAPAESAWSTHVDPTIDRVSAEYQQLQQGYSGPALRGMEQQQQQQQLAAARAAQLPIAPSGFASPLDGVGASPAARAIGSAPAAAASYPANPSNAALPMYPLPYFSGGHQVSTPHMHADKSRGPLLRVDSVEGAMKHTNSYKLLGVAPPRDLIARLPIPGLVMDISATTAMTTTYTRSPRQATQNTKSDESEILAEDENSSPSAESPISRGPSSRRHRKFHYPASRIGEFLRDLEMPVGTLTPNQSFVGLIGPGAAATTTSPQRTDAGSTSESRAAKVSEKDSYSSQTPQETAVENPHEVEKVTHAPVIHFPEPSQSVEQESGQQHDALQLSHRNRAADAAHAGKHDSDTNNQDAGNRKVSATRGAGYNGTHASVPFCEPLLTLVDVETESITSPREEQPVHSPNQGGGDADPEAAAAAIEDNAVGQVHAPTSADVSAPPETATTTNAFVEGDSESVSVAHVVAQPPTPTESNEVQPAGVEDVYVDVDVPRHRSRSGRHVTPVNELSDRSVALPQPRPLTNEPGNPFQMNFAVSIPCTFSGSMSRLLSSPSSSNVYTTAAGTTPTSSREAFGKGNNSTFCLSSQTTGQSPLHDQTRFSLLDGNLTKNGANDSIPREMSGHASEGDNAKSILSATHLPSLIPRRESSVKEGTTSSESVLQRNSIDSLLRSPPRKPELMCSQTLPAEPLAAPDSLTSLNDENTSTEPPQNATHTTPLNEGDPMTLRTTQDESDTLDSPANGTRGGGDRALELALPRGMMERDLSVSKSTIYAPLQPSHSMAMGGSLMFDISEETDGALPDLLSFDAKSRGAESHNRVVQRLRPWQRILQPGGFGAASGSSSKGPHNASESLSLDVVSKETSCNDMNALGELSTHSPELPSPQGGTSPFPGQPWKKETQAQTEGANANSTSRGAHQTLAERTANAAPHLDVTNDDAGYLPDVSMLTVTNSTPATCDSPALRETSPIAPKREISANTSPGMDELVKHIQRLDVAGSNSAEQVSTAAEPSGEISGEPSTPAVEDANDGDDDDPSGSSIIRHSVSHSSSIDDDDDDEEEEEERSSTEYQSSTRSKSRSISIRSFVPPLQASAPASKELRGSTLQAQTSTPTQRVAAAIDHPRDSLSHDATLQESGPSNEEEEGEMDRESHLQAAANTTLPFDSHAVPSIASGEESTSRSPHVNASVPAPTQQNKSKPKRRPQQTFPLLYGLMLLQQVQEDIEAEQNP